MVIFVGLKLSIKSNLTVNSDKSGTEDEAYCDNFDYPVDPDEDSECPLNTNEVVFIPGEFCDNYYICLNGVPNVFFCREGQHWNTEKNHCDDPHNAGCDVGEQNS